MEQATFLKINPADSVVVCLSAKKQGDIIEVDGKQITVNQDTPAGHKVLIKDVKQGENIIKYGYPIGHAREDLKAGDWVNENNLKTNLSGTLEYTYQPVNEKLSIKDEKRTFKGYVRKNGDVAYVTRFGLFPLSAASMALPSVWQHSFVRRLARKISMLFGRGITTMVARSFLKTTRTPVRCFATFVCTPMPVVYWC